MRRAVFRTASLALPFALATWLGCGHKGGVAADDADAGPDADVDVTASPPPVDPPADAGTAPPCEPDIQPDGLAQHLRCAGLYANIADKTIAAGVRAYTPGAPLWSDGATKARFLYLPPGTTIDTTDFDHWKWPKGTRLWKEFSLEGRRIETRLYAKMDDGTWKRTVYLWNADETDAERMELGEQVPVDGGPPYEVPATGHCDLCHVGHAEPPLGLAAFNLGLPDAKGASLAELSDAGLLSSAPPQTTVSVPDDPGLAAGVAPAALTWLHANCGSCHNPNASASANLTNLFFEVRASQLASDGGTTTAKTLDAYTTAVCKQAGRLNTGTGTFYTRVVGGDPASSLVAILATSRAPAGQPPTTLTQMPPILSHLVDPAGKLALDTWITALPACP